MQKREMRETYMQFQLFQNRGQLQKGSQRKDDICSVLSFTDMHVLYKMLQIDEAAGASCKLKHLIQQWQ